MTASKKYLLVDGRNLLWRASQAHTELCAKINGERVMTGAMYGFIMTLISVHERHGGRTIVAWEGKRNFRFNLYPGYKQRRQNVPDPEAHEALIQSLNDQQRRLQYILTYAGIPQYTGEGCEADDILATLATQLDGEVIIYTMDSDLRQVVDKRVKVLSSGFKGDVLYGKKQVIERHQVLPKRLPDLKALMGDTSDCIPGAKGIGEKTALQLLGQYRTLNDIVKAARAGAKDWPISERFREVVKSSAKQLRIFKQCTTVLRDAHIIEIPAQRNRAKLRRKLAKYQFRTLAYNERVGAVLNLAG